MTSSAPVRSSTTHGVDVDLTVGLTKGLEDGLITHEEYVRRRAAVVGRGNVFSAFVIPVLSVFLRIDDLAHVIARARQRRNAK